MTAAGRRQDEPDHDDLPDIRAALAGEIGQVAEALVGDKPNRGMSKGHKLRFGRKGALSVITSGSKGGAWYDHAAGCGGGPLDLVLHLRQQGFADALDWARAWTGIGREEGRRRPSPAPRPPPPANNEGDDARIAIARGMWGEAVPVTGTLGERYLTRVRGIPAPAGGWPDAVRYHARTRSLILAATLPDGTVQAVQRVVLAADGTNARDEAGGKIKRSHGPQAGAVVRLPALPGQASGPLLLAEGPETGLSLWGATGHETWVTLGSMAKAEPPGGRRVVTCADDDPPAADIHRGAAARTLQDGLRRWRQAGADVVRATPYATPQGEGADFNDLLRERGLEAVQDRVEMALAPLVLPFAAVVRVGAADARLALDGVVSRFVDLALGWPLPEPGVAAPPPPVHMVKIDVGVGKSETARRHAARMLGAMRAAGDGRAVVIAVPTHELGDGQAWAFEDLPEARAHGLKARVWRGRAAPDPVRPGSKMCDDLEAVEMVRAVHGDVSAMACGTTKDGPACPFRGSCGYQRQKRDARPDLWIVAHELLFTKPPRELGGIAAVVVDESFYEAGLLPAVSFPLDALDGPLGASATALGVDRLLFLRRRLLGVLRDLPDGPVPRAALVGALFDQVNTGEAYSLEWRRLVPVEMYPGMNRKARREAQGAAQVNRDVGRQAGLWAALKDLVAPGGPERSGWVELARDNDGGRVLQVSGRANVKAGWQVPTLILDATLDLALVRSYYPQSELVAELAVATPHQRVTQVVDKSFGKGMYAPLSDGDRAATTAQNNLRKLRAILCRAARRYHPGRVLAVVQEAVEDGLKALGNLPPNLDLAHHNAVSGLDHWRDVRALIVVGRTLPGPAAVEAMAAQLTGRQPDAVKGWYARVPTVREMADGQAVAADAERHPDPVAEAIRWQIAEGQLVQIIGRGRGVNRTADTPLDVLVMTDLPLPLPVDKLTTAAALAPSSLDLMLAEGGVALLNPRDAVVAYPGAAYPGLWRTWEAAKKALERDQKGTNAYEILLIGVCPLLVEVSYQVAGERRRRVGAVVDLAVVPNPRAWLEDRLGPLARYELLTRGAATPCPASPCAAWTAPQPEPVPDAPCPAPRPAPVPACAARPVTEEEIAMDPLQDAPTPAAVVEELPEQRGLDPGLIYRRPMAWPSTDLLVQAGRRTMQVPTTTTPVVSP